MNVYATKLACWLSSAGLTFGLAGYAASFFSQIEAKQTPVASDHVVGLLRSQAQAPEGSEAHIDYTQVKATFHYLNWTGKVQEEVVLSPDPEEQAPSVVSVRELLRILMVQENTVDPAESLVFVRFTAPGLPDEPAALAPGDRLPSPHQGISVRAIRADGVEFAFANGRADETLGPGSFQDEALIVRVGPDGVRVPVRRGLPGASTGAPYRPERTTEVAPGRWRIGVADASEFERNYSAILANDVRSRTYHDPRTGRRAGIEILSVKPGSIAARHGVAEGDILISINGEPMTSQQQGIQFFKNNSDVYTSWEVVIENMGRRRTETYESAPN